MKNIARFCIILFCLSYYPIILTAKGAIPITKKMVITQSVTIKRSVYKINADPALNSGIIEIKGDNITVDFNGSVLKSRMNENFPDQFSGVAIYIQGGKNITIKNAIIKGYKIAVMGRDVHNLKIENCNFSYNFRQHLNSDRKREDLSDWQSYHHNENDQWLRYGAGIYLESCDSMVVRNDTVMDGQCGLMMTKCSDGIIYNNNFSFNSGIGIGFYQSSYNKVMNNKLDWNVRGFSYGVYARGQDAAAILVYEQSSHNIFAYNSATHSGDGFFLWAGAYTMKTGKGGCNDNLIYDNDFSYAPTNGVEATFSTNKIIDNTIYGCDHGVWGGYSYKTLIMGNRFGNNNTGIAIEQGQNNRIVENSFIGDKMGIQLWATPGRRMEGDYDKIRDVSSMNYVIQNNLFYKEGRCIFITHSSNVLIQNNKISRTTQFIQLDSSVEKTRIKNNISVNKQLYPHNELHSQFAPMEIKDAGEAITSNKDSLGRRYIMMTEWGPYDFQSPILWRTKTDSDGEMDFDIPGPRGSWKVKSVNGVYDLSAEQGGVPGRISVHKKPNEPIDIILEYSGQEVISPFGKKYAAGTSYVFSYKKMYLPTTWKVQLFSFTDVSDPIKYPSNFEKMLQSSSPLKQISVKELDNSFWNKFGSVLPNGKFATISSAKINFPKAYYRIGISAGDIVKVYIDNKLVINAWDPSKLIYDADYHHQVFLPLKGQHTIRIVQAQYGSYGMLYVTLTPVVKNDQGR
ncbi:MAG: hypothetical protein EPN37_13740 [Chitinophagaceae bacterium]|nr:MAG: hypothetical protein EPN37_13740 [Chitinophagaceae bacterium]